MDYPYVSSLMPMNGSGGGGGGGESKVFAVTYGTTTFANIKSALDAGKICTMTYNGEIFIATYYDATGALFTNTQGDYCDIATVSSGNVWSSSVEYLLPMNQGSGNAGKFLVVGNDGNIVPVTMTQWNGGNY